MLVSYWKNYWKLSYFVSVALSSHRIDVVFDVRLQTRCLYASYGSSLPGSWPGRSYRLMLFIRNICRDINSCIRGIMVHNQSERKGGLFLKKLRWECITGQFIFIKWIENVNWPPWRISKRTFWALSPRQSVGPIRSDEELPLETSASKLLVAIIRYQLSW